MIDDQPTDEKWMERKWALPLATAALIASYPLLLFLDAQRYDLLYILLLGLPSALGILAAWLAIKRLKIDESPVFKKIHLHPKTLAFGLGGPLAGLFFLQTTCFQSTCLMNNGGEEILGFIVMQLPVFGQGLWLLWPLAVVKAICPNRLELVKICDTVQRFILIFCAAALVPGMVFVGVPLFEGINSMVCR